MTVHYQTDTVTVHHGDCLDVLHTLPDASIDAVVTDPPYGISFMGRQWDQPGKFRSVTPAPRPVNDKPREGLAMEAGRYDLTPTGIRNFQAWCEAWATECLRVLKPGGHLLSFGGSRTWHRLSVAVEDAGFEIRDSIAWLYGSGFPKSMDVSKAIDKIRDDTEHIRVVSRWLRARIDEHPTETIGTIAERFSFHPRMVEHWAARDTDSQPSVPKLEQWDALRSVLGFGDERDAEVLRLNLRKGEPGEAWKDRPVTGEVEEWENRTNYALTSRDGLRRDTATTEDAKAWQGWGTALKPGFEPVVVGRKPLAGTVAANVLEHGTGALNIDATRIEGRERTDYGLATATRSSGAVYGEPTSSADFDSSKGRFPTNVLLETSQAEALDAQTGFSLDGLAVNRNRTGDRPMTVEGAPRRILPEDAGYGGGGGASRFFPTFHYEAKAPSTERPEHDGTQHPTVKPLDLMRWLVRLVTPPGGTVLEPFAGSGTTVEACLIEGFSCIAIEREADYLPLILKRIRKDIQPSMFGDWDV